MLQILNKSLWHIEARLLSRGPWETYGTTAQHREGFHGIVEVFEANFEETAEKLHQLSNLMPSSEFRLVSFEMQTGVIRKNKDGFFTVANIIDQGIKGISKKT